MRKLHGLFTVFASVVLMTTVNSASATPPTGQFSATEHGRVQQAAATITIPPADNVSANYTIAPGGDTAWRTATGDSIIAVFKGTLTVEQATDCAGQEVTAGKTVAIPAGKFRLHNAGSSPAEFSGVFFNLPVGGPTPLVEGDAESAPDCAGFSATAAPGGVTATDPARGGTGRYAADGSTKGAGGVDTSAPVVHSLEAGKDMFVVTYTFEPGAATGWLTHTEEIAILTQGRIAIWEGRDGQCKKIEDYKAGDAWAHKPHRHMGTIEGDETAILRIVGWNLPHGEPKPGVGSSPDHIDFTQAPPAECPRLR
jgi:quercetin dioxygenase-like cupin family protein